MDVQLVIESGSPKRQTIRLRSEETIVGRRVGCDLRIPSGEVSRRHCRLSFRDGILLVEDLDSSNGTFLNGERVKGVEVVRPGDRLDVGPICFRAKYQLSAAAIDRLLKAETPPPPPDSVPELVFEEFEAAEVVEELVEVEVEESDTAQSGLTASDAAPPQAAAAAAVPEDEQAAVVDPEAAQAVSDIFDDDKRRWQPPQGNIRDILSQLDDS